MWAEVNGERKKVACGPCIRGHRSSKCDHRDRVLVEVRKPGRPLSSCPHPSGSCSCERIVINYTIPKSSECACPSDRAQPATATVAGNSRIQKNRRKSTVVNAASIEKAMRAGQDAETDTSSVTHTATDRTGSNEASPVSSASSTPRLPPTQKVSSSCCQPKPVQPQPSSCCSSKKVELPPPVKSCCSGTSTQSTPTPGPSSVGQMNNFPDFSQPIPYQASGQFPAPQYQHFNMHGSAHAPGPLPFTLGAPIYSHVASAYRPHPQVPMSPVIPGHLVATSQGGQRPPEHNCHCGDSCSCFGCAAHPNNATMMEYVRLMAQFQYTGGFGSMPPPPYDLPTYPHHPGYGAEAYGQTHGQMPPPATSSVSFTSGVAMSSLPSTPVPWSQPPLSALTIPGPQMMEPSSYTAPTPGEEGLLVKDEEPISSPVGESPDGSKDDDTSTLSPSSYFWNQMVLPNCSDATGTCQCGDGCECVGCLTHGGHNGVQLEAPSSIEAPDFPEFASDAGLVLDETNDFLNFQPTPAG